jgi:hypothetical protein
LHAYHWRTTVNASSIRPLPYLLGGFVKPPQNDRSTFAQPVEPRRCALTTGYRVGDRAALGTSNVPQAH